MAKLGLISETHIKLPNLITSKLLNVLLEFRTKYEIVAMSWRVLGVLNLPSQSNPVPFFLFLKPYFLYPPPKLSSACHIATIITPDLFLFISSISPNLCINIYLSFLDSTLWLKLI